MDMAEVGTDICMFTATLVSEGAYVTRAGADILGLGWMV